MSLPDFPLKQLNTFTHSLSAPIHELIFAEQQNSLLDRIISAFSRQSILYQRALEAFSDSPTIEGAFEALQLAPQSEKWRFIGEKARLQLASGEPNSAIASIREDNEINAHPQMLLLLAASYENANQYREAHNQFKTLLTRKDLTPEHISYAKEAAIRNLHTLANQTTLSNDDLVFLTQNQTAQELFEKRASASELSAMRHLATCYARGIGVNPSSQLFIHWLTKAALLKDPIAQYTLGHQYFHGVNVEKNLKTAVDLYKQVSAQGNSDAQCDLGHCYHHGFGVEKDLDKAAELFSQAANQGNAFAQAYLGYCYLKGMGVTTDLEKAVELFSHAANQGHTYAQYALGNCYLEGLGVATDLNKAFDLYNQAAVQGDAAAQTNLGVCYEKGLGVKPDHKNAVELYKKGADQGIATAQYNLGHCYEHGLGVTTDFKKAAEFYKLAANQGNTDAQNNLGFCYENGLGVEIDLKKALELYTQAAQGGHLRAKEKLEKWNAEFSTSQMIAYAIDNAFTIALRS